VVVAVGEEPGVGPAREAASRLGRVHRSKLAAVAVASVALGGLVLVEGRVGHPADDGAIPTSTTERRPRSTVRPPPGDPDPPASLPGATGLWVVTPGPTLRVTDLDTGLVTIVSGIRTSGFSHGAVAVGDGGLVGVDNEGVLYVPDLVPDAASVDLGDGDQALASDRTDRVWIIVDPFDNPIFGVRDMGLAARSSRTAREVDLTGEVTAGPITLPTGVTPLRGVPGGLLVNSPDGIFLVHRGGDARRVARGTPIDTFGASLVHHACDPDMRCWLQVTDVATGEWRRLDGDWDLPASYWFGDAIVSPDGRRLAWHTFSEGRLPGMDVVDLTTGTVVRSDSFLGHGSAAWSPDGQWLIRASHGGGLGTATESHAVRIEDGETFELNLPPGDHGIVVFEMENP
jgi:hypothetical protein